MVLADDEWDGVRAARMEGLNTFYGNPASSYAERNLDLTGIGVREFAELEVDNDAASEPSVEKQQINPIPLVPDTQSVLAPHKGEIASELEEETLQFAKQSVLELAF